MDLTNFQTAIRVDAQTQQGSILDVIRLINPNLTSGNAANTLNAMTTWMTINHSHILINGKGKPTPVADARTLIEIIWALPGKAAREFRRASAATVCRVLGGDVSLLAEIEARSGALQQTAEGRSVQSFLLHQNEDQAAAAHPKHAPTELELATADQRQTYVNCWLARQHGEVVQQRMTMLKSAVDLMQALDGVDEGDKIEFRDRIRLAMRPSDTQGLTEGAAVAEVDPGPGTATHDCSESVTGSEISTPTQIGKRMKKLYAQRFGDAAAQAIP